MTPLGLYSKWRRNAFTGPPDSSGGLVSRLIALEILNVPFAS